MSNHIIMLFMKRFFFYCNEIKFNKKKLRDDCELHSISVFLVYFFLPFPQKKNRRSPKNLYPFFFLFEFL